MKPEPSGADDLQWAIDASMGDESGLCPSYVWVSLSGEELAPTKFRCSRPSGHEGRHETRDESGTPLVYWPEERGFMR